MQLPNSVINLLTAATLLLSGAAAAVTGKTDAGYFAGAELTPAWQQYLARSKADALLLAQHQQHELQQAGLAKALLAIKAKNFGLDGIHNAAELKALLSYQTVLGGFSKRTDMRQPRQLGMLAGSEAAYIPTFDNGATSSQIRWLAAYYAKGSPDGQQQIELALPKAIHYLLRAQYPNGGFPQSYPLRGGYHDAVTLNDNVMSDLLQLLWDIAHQSQYAWLAPELRQQALSAFHKGVDWLLAAQVVINGAPTIWSAQHHPLTAAPVAARKFEQVSLVTSESAAVLQLLLTTVPDNTAVQASLCYGVRWLQAQQIRDKSWQRSDSGSALVATPGAVTWARFYSIPAQQPVFFDRDGQVYHEVGQLSLERQQGYGWYQTNAKTLLKAWAKQATLRAQCAARLASSAS